MPKIELTLRNQTQKRGPTAALLRRLFEQAAKTVGINTQRLGVSVTILGPTAIRKLNHKHRQLDKPTDVLSFPLHAKLTKSAIMDLGDIFLCPAVIAKEAVREKTSLRQRQLMLALHGFLHLLGHDHANARQYKVMFALQDKILAHFR